LACCTCQGLGGGGGRPSAASSLSRALRLCDAGDGTYTIIAGTGKYAGMTGNGEWHLIQFLPPTSDKYVRGIFANTMHWRLPQ
jgi:hypothetical protein